MRKLILIDPQPLLCKAFKKAFAGHGDVEIVQGIFQRLPAFDCMVSAANSFGIMDGGVDLAIRDFFGKDLEHRVQERIIKEYRGGQPVGTSMIVETQHERHPYIAHTPTMRVPLKITRLDNVYNAMYAMLLAVHQHNEAAWRKIHIVACPGLGTATGGLPPDEAARQMELAYRHFMNPPDSINWHYATSRQKDIIYGQDMFG